ncbi:MAG TPA: chromosomal replication initiator protein DnaA [Solirubrobacteraceae bacterium]|nr:chromosomal replication initiator protein DnaA [Solirubrobacteraceae bacterium]
MSDELEHIWSRVQAQLALVVDEPTYRIWLTNLKPRELVGEVLSIEAPPQTCRWIQGRFGRVIEASVELVLGPHASVELCPADAEPSTRRIADSSRPSALPDTTARPRAPHRSGPIGNPKLTFDHFVIGDSNRLAHAAALTVAEMPAQAYNPLFICGPPGVGKTHLLSAIANLITAHDPTLAVRTTTGEAFTNEFLGALGDRSTDQFKARFRDIDVLLVDDVQFLERKTRTEEEFFHTFNALHDAGRQVVLTSDRPPHDLQALEDRLRERFEAGLVADVRPPDLPTRLAILRKRAHHDGVALADDTVLETIAQHVHTNVRALEGALIRVVAFSSLTGRPLTTELAREVLASLYPRPARAGAPRTIAEIQQATCSEFGLTPEELLSTSRGARVSLPRQIAMYLSRELTNASLPAIGREFGGRDHTTVMHACKRTSSRIASDHITREAVEKLREMLDRDAS